MRCGGAPDSHGVRSAARARRGGRARGHPRRSCCGGSGDTTTSATPGCSTSTSGACGARSSAIPTRRVCAHRPRPRLSGRPPRMRRAGLPVRLSLRWRVALAFGLGIAAVHRRVRHGDLEPGVGLHAAPAGDQHHPAGRAQRPAGGRLAAGRIGGSRRPADRAEHRLRVDGAAAPPRGLDHQRAAGGPGAAPGAPAGPGGAGGARAAAADGRQGSGARGRRCPSRPPTPSTSSCSRSRSSTGRSGSSARCSARGWH